MKGTIQASDLVAAIAELKKGVEYQYPDDKNRGRVRIISVERPEGPIKFVRYDPSKAETPDGKLAEQIGPAMLQRVAAGIREGVPFQVDRILGASYNTRAVLEALLAHTPQFTLCFPGRIHQAGSVTRVQKGHKHLLWDPSSPHTSGTLEVRDTSSVVSEQTIEVVYESLALPQRRIHEEMGDEVSRRHAQMQIALILAGERLGMRTYIAKNDQGIEYGKKRLVEMPSVVADLGKESMFSAYQSAAERGALIDAIWFRGDRAMPAVFEVEHTTGVISGLARMQSFKNMMPPYLTRYVIVAPDDDRDMVLQKIADQQFAELGAGYMPYSAVEELYSLALRRELRGVKDDFVASFIESPTSC